MTCDSVWGQRVSPGIFVNLCRLSLVRLIEPIDLVFECLKLNHLQLPQIVRSRHPVIRDSFLAYFITTILNHLFLVRDRKIRQTNKKERIHHTHVSERMSAIELTLESGERLGSLKDARIYFLMISHKSIVSLQLSRPITPG